MPQASDIILTPSCIIQFQVWHSWVAFKSLKLHTTLNSLNETRLLLKSKVQHSLLNSILYQRF